MSHSWQPIATAPKDERVLMLYVPQANPQWQVQTGRYVAKAKAWRSASALCLPTHWMPLPAPPQE